MPGFSNQSFTPAQISSSTLIKSGEGRIGGVFVSAASSTPTITFYNNTAGSGAKIIDTFTPTAGTFYEMPAAFDVGCYAALGGTVSCTIFYI